MTNFQFIVDKALNKFKKAKRIAVENFAGTCDKLDMAANMNLEMDAASYKWHPHTTAAIRYVIQNKVGETLAGACKIGNRGFVFPKVETEQKPADNCCEGGQCLCSTAS